MAMITDINYYDDWARPHIVSRILLNGKKLYSWGVVPLDVLIENQPSKYKKIKAKGTCEICKEDFNILWNKFCRRVNSKTKMRSICGPCAVKVATHSNEWKNKNSKAQLKAQGTPEARERMSKILIESWEKDPDIGKRISESLKKRYREDPSFRKKVSEASKRNWEREEYRNKVTPKGFHHGIFHSKCNGNIFFASSWELMFLVWCDNNEEVISFGRCKDRIKYKQPNGKKARYHPDFQVDFKSEVWISEVKGSRSDYDLVERKREAAQKFYNESNKIYVMIYKEDLQRLECFKKQKKVREWLKDLANERKITYYGGPKKEDKENIQGKSS